MFKHCKFPECDCHGPESRGVCDSHHQTKSAEEFASRHTRIEIYGGKYTFLMTCGGTIAKILRHGEDWPASDDLVHVGAVLALVQEIIDLRQDKVEKRLQYLGALGVLSQASVLVDDDTRERIELCFEDACKDGSLSWHQTLDRMEIEPVTHD